MDRMSDNAQRARLQFAAQSLANEHAPVGSLFLYTLGCAFLSAPDASDFESTLERLFLDQADKEEVDGDEILTALCGVIEVAAP
jgi:hypothetical protein